MPRRNRTFAVFARMHPCAGMVVAIAIALLASTGWADDPSYREIPQAATPSTQELLGRLTGLKIPPRQLVEAIRSRELQTENPKEPLMEPKARDAAPLTENLPPFVREAIKSFQRQPNREEQGPINPELPSHPQHPATPDPNDPAEPATVPSQVGRPDRTNSLDAVGPPRKTQGGRSDQRDFSVESNPQLREDEFTPRRRTEDEAPTSPPARLSPPDAAQRQRSSQAPSENLRLRINTEDARRLSSIPRPAQSSPQSPERPVLKTQKQINEALNKILFDAAQQAVKVERSGELLEASTSRESFLNPLVKRLHTMLAEPRRSGWRPERQLRSTTRRAAEWSRDRRFKFSLAVPEAPSGATISDAAGKASLLAAPLVLALAALLLLPVWRRLQGRFAGVWGRASATRALPTRPVESPADLVRALDQFLVYQFGRAATWWHLRAVERALAGLAPLMRAEVAQLVAAYEFSRYAPRSQPVSDDQLEQSAATLRRLVAMRVAEGQGRS